MSSPVFDHERLDVYRIAIKYGATSYNLARTLTGVDRHIRDQWLRACQSIPLNIAEGNGKEGPKDRSRYLQIARGSAYECAAIHDILEMSSVIDSAANLQAKTQLRRIASMLTGLIQRNR